jgi:hypothetical protein
VGGRTIPSGLIANSITAPKGNWVPFAHIASAGKPQMNGPEMMALAGINAGSPRASSSTCRGGAEVKRACRVSGGAGRSYLLVVNEQRPVLALKLQLLRHDCHLGHLV